MKMITVTMNGNSKSSTIISPPQEAQPDPTTTPLDLSLLDLTFPDQSLSNISLIDIYKNKEEKEELPVNSASPSPNVQS